MNVRDRRGGTVRWPVKEAAKRCTSRGPDGGPDANDPTQRLMEPSMIDRSVLATVISIRVCS